MTRQLGSCTSLGLTTSITRGEGVVLLPVALLAPGARLRGAHPRRALRARRVRSGGLGLVARLVD
eukprot:scaffold17580_cov95-Phaeocystis_antarctica.AAC.2